ncbi:uncharacterized protein DUF397 [Herbihabitans rhizosphaerae]|uniref:Uncharacterized protein DUF397 n=1 Tax=Herbihabitans rhizosphaerae TaxID=1872711 RepID=A0A4Q7KXW4_9PSEU|nr:DUF397 domain-containing protein [Herbihabitans rhizosphaerae]RZS41190.1 uncharacterized protein DUF397 [Herbihabitans rhizosphaerae]
MPDHRWRKATHSENGSDCVELRGTLDRVRDSKNPGGPVLRGNVPALLRTIKTGHKP